MLFLNFGWNSTSIEFFYLQVFAGKVPALLKTGKYLFIRLEVSAGLLYVKRIFTEELLPVCMQS